MYCWNGSSSPRAQVVALEDVESFSHRNPARRRRRCADDLVSSIGPSNGFALFYLVIGQVPGSEQPAALLHSGRELPCHGAVVKISRIAGDASKRPCQVGLLQYLAGFVEIPIPLKDALRLGKLAQRFIFLQVARVGFGEGEPLFRQFDGWRHHSVQRQLAVLLLGVDHASNRPGNPNCFVADMFADAAAGAFSR